MNLNSNSTFFVEPVNVLAMLEFSNIAPHIYIYLIPVIQPVILKSDILIDHCSYLLNFGYRIRDYSLLSGSCC